MGWLDNFLPKTTDDSEASFDRERRQQYPEQYPATYELLSPTTEESETIGDNKNSNKEAKLVRPLLKQTQLEQRPLYVAYDARKDGWNPTAFHTKVDGKGASIVLATTKEGKIVGGYNPKGWASMGGARPSVAAFLFYNKNNDESSAGPIFQKLKKVGGGGLACAFDGPNEGIYFGPDGLVIPLAENNPKWAVSKLGPYFERGPEELSTLFLPNAGAHLVDLKVLVGIYSIEEEIPYSGAVLDMTSG